MRVIKNAELRYHTNYELGGQTPELIVVETVDELTHLGREILHNAEVIGGGTNLLVSDTGVDKPVIKIAFSGYIPTPDAQVLAYAGHKLSNMAMELSEQGYRGMEFAIGIPGTVGGAVVMNAGTDRFIADILKCVEVLTRDGDRKVIQAEDLKYRYRESILQEKDWIVLSATFKLLKGDPLSKELIIERLEGRKRNHPMSFPSAGCWFKGPWGCNDIIREVGMAGKWRGGAVSSPLFPAFILNVGATASDIYALVREIEEKAAKIGKPLKREIKLLGKFDD